MPVDAAYALLCCSSLTERQTSFQTLNRKNAVSKTALNPDTHKTNEDRSGYRRKYSWYTYYQNEKKITMTDFVVKN